MLGSKRSVFKPTPYNYSRRKRRIPRWLVLMITGAILGVGGLLFIQTSYGPTRLTVEQSEKLGFELNSANAENQRLQNQLSSIESELETTQAALDSQRDKLEKHDETVARYQSEVALLLSAVAPDPRGTNPAINAATFSYKDNLLHQELLLTQDEATADTPFNGAIKLVVMGRYPNGKTGYVDLGPFPLTLGRYKQVAQEHELPNSMVPRQVTVQILESDTGRQRATRILNVR